MSAIAGIACFDGGMVEARHAERMAAAMAWRGRDDDGSYRSPEGRVALAIRRLATLDRCADCCQPLANETHDVWLVLDGQILNNRTLRHSLELAGHRFRTASDAEAALHAYEQWDLDFPNHLQGAFALALWDDRRDRLVLVRDRLGRKPLFVAEHHNRLAFASGIRPVLDALNLPRRFDAAGLADLLGLGFVPAPRSIAAGVSKLAAGEMLVAERGLPRRRFVWGSFVPEDRRALSTRSLPLDRQAANLRTLLECAVADRLMGDGPLAVQFDGTPEAGAVAAIAARFASRPAHAIAVVGTDGGNDEALCRLRSMAAVARAELSQVTVPPREALAALPDIAKSSPEPSSNPEAVTGWFAARAVSSTDAAAMLTATGARTVLLTDGAYKPSRRSHVTARLRRLLPFPVGRAHAQFLPSEHAPFADADWRSVLTVEVAGELPDPSLPEPRLPTWAGTDALEILGITDLAGRVCDGVIPMCDASAQAHGIEAHLPFLDDSYVGYAMAIPGILRSPAGSPYLIARRSFGDLLPPGFAVGDDPLLPVMRWLASDWGREIAHSVAVHALMRVGLRVEAVLGRPRALWTVTSLALWADEHGFEGIGPAMAMPADMAQSRS